MSLKKYGHLTLEANEDKSFYTVINCERDAQEVSIPLFTDGIPIHRIEEEAFKHCKKLRSLVFLDGNENDPLYHTGLEIDDYAFSYLDALETVELPYTLNTYIGRGAFYYCTSLSKISFSPYTTVSAYAFHHCESLIDIPKISDIDEGTFGFCYKLPTLPITENIRVISEDCFEHCYALKEIIIPKSVKRIEALAFRNCRGLTRVSFEETKGWYSSNSYRDHDVEIDVSDPELMAKELAGMDFDDGTIAWYRK